MSQTALMRQLKSNDPKDRFRAIKQIAKERDDTMLKFLNDMAQNDPDPQVQAVAAKAVKYIKGDNDFSQAEDSPRKKKKHSGPVSEADANRAQGYVEEALTYQMNNERTKALKSLNKALRLNPSLETDSYFISVLDEITGLSGEESLNLLYDSNRQKEIAVTEKQLKKEKGIQSHMDDVHRATWASAAMDLTIYAFILIFGTMLTVLVVSQGASNLMPNYASAVEAYNVARSEGNMDAEPPAMPALDAQMTADAVNQLGLGVGTGVIVGLIVGVSGVIGLLMQLGLIHVVARYLFQGNGTLPYLIYKVVSFYNSRIIIVFLLMMLYFYLMVTMGSSAFLFIIAGVLGIYNLYITFAVIGRVGQTYDFGFLMGCLSMLVAGVALSIITSIPVWLIGSTLFNTFFSEMMMSGM